LRLKTNPRMRFAGQITGVEGYVESAAIGLLAGRFASAELLGDQSSPPPQTTALGALLAHITGGHLAEADQEGHARSFQPMNVNFGLFPDLPECSSPDGKRPKGAERGRMRKRALAERALKDLGEWLQHTSHHMPEHAGLVKAATF
jgi:methylenetetrahydrofolate--tRNA-(uracil-5-)-methyltransferase